jgi:MerR family transcriptional regulator/heat shock protein HspR
MGSRLDAQPALLPYAISVAAQLTGVQPQMLRTYEARGLLDPFRTDGGTRRYSAEDVERARRITTMLASGLNLEGVQQVLALQHEVSRLQALVDAMRAHHEPADR